MEAEEIRWRVPSIFWVPFIASIILLFIVNIFQINYYTIQPINILEQTGLVQEQDNLRGFLIKTPGCRIPYMDPFDAHIKKFLHKEKKPKCNGGIPALYDANLTSVFLINTSLSYYGDWETLKCHYRPLYRKRPVKGEKDNKVVFGPQVNLEESAEIHEEFIRVICEDQTNKTVYTDFFSFIPIKNDGNNKKLVRKGLDVLIVGLDGVSRLNFIRQMPMTVAYLRNLSAIELLGYNKVGDNTFPNLVPFLTGFSEDEIRKTCWKNESYFDNCTYLWDIYKKNGYLTSFGEDSAWMGIFSYSKKGFLEQPTDYMWGPFNLVSEQQIGNSHNLNVNECVGAREVYQVLLDHITKFVVRMNQEQLPYFAFYWGASLSHDYLNKPEQGDESYLQFFQNLHENGHLNNTLLVMMSDHGIRWGDIRQTYQGRIEERMPFIFFLLPDWYTRQYPNAYRNLIKNTRRLTTPYDLHQTLLELNNQQITKSPLNNSNSNKSHGTSLFNEINKTRTCEDAGISTHWCTCQQSLEVAKNDSIVIRNANFAINYINKQLTGYGQCAELKLNKILNARLMKHAQHLLEDTEMYDYTITLQTEPGFGIFEVTIRQTKLLKTVYEAYHLEVMGTISRLNLYGKQSACITDFHLKLYCYCKSLL